MWIRERVVHGEVNLAGKLFSNCPRLRSESDRHTEER